MRRASIKVCGRGGAERGLPTTVRLRRRVGWGQQPLHRPPRKRRRRPLFAAGLARFARDSRTVRAQDALGWRADRVRAWVAPRSVRRSRVERANSSFLFFLSRAGSARLTRGPCVRTPWA
eukprot:8845358-Lingulodinium_polyedra.AAC.1